MPKPSVSHKPRCRIYLLAGVATAPNFMETLGAALVKRMEEAYGYAAECRLLFPYGDWSRSLWRQLRDIRRDLRLPFTEWEKSIGGNVLYREVLRSLTEECSPPDRMLLIGHSGGGIAALQGASLLQEWAEYRSIQIIQIGSPRHPVPPFLRDRTSYFFAVSPSGRIKDPICRIGGWGGWEKRSFGLHLWNRHLHAPERRLPLSIQGGHADYFRTHLTNGKGQSNLELVVSTIFDIFQP